jgi:hypothetical protein
MRFILAAAALLAAASAGAQGPPDPQVAIAAQKAGMAKLSFLDGVWRGPAWAITPTGDRHEVTQTERIGPFLGGSVRIIEGRGYVADGSVGFNALGIISFDPRTGSYSLRSYAMGQKGDFPLKVTTNGYEWETPAGPGAVIRYTATVSKSEFREVGDRVVGSAAPVRIFEMKLKRVGDTKWPSGDAVPMR